MANESDIQVSIHTPTKGVTASVFWNYKDKAVSIHTPTKGVTRRGCAAYATTWVSIHTPTKGVTADLAQDKEEDEFQSTHPRRV